MDQDLAQAPVQRPTMAVSKILKGHTDAIRSVAFSADGSRIVSGSFDKTIRVWDVASGEVVAGPFKGHTAYVRSVAFSPDAKRIASSSDDGSVRVWDVAGGSEVVARPFRSSDRVYSVAFSPDGSRIVSGLQGNIFTAINENFIRISDAAGGDVALGTLIGHTNSVFSVAFSPDGSRIVSGGWDKTIRVWDATTGEALAGPFKGHVDPVESVMFSPDSRYIVSGSRDKTIRVWDAASGDVVAGPFEGHTNTVWSVSFSPEGTRIVSGSDDHTIRLWDASSGETIAGPFTNHTYGVSSVSFSPDGTRVVSGSGDSTIRLWDVAIGRVVSAPSNSVISTGSNKGFHDGEASQLSRAAPRQDLFISWRSGHAGQHSIDYDCEELCNFVDKLVRVCPFDSALSLVKSSMRAVVNRICVCSTIKIPNHFLLVYFHDQAHPTSRRVAIISLAHGEL